MKLCLIVASLCVSSVALADSFKVDWTLTIPDDTITLAKESYSFKAGGMKCDVSRAVKEYSPDLGLGLVEKRDLTCHQGKKIIHQEIYCTRKQIENFAEIAVGSDKINLSCNVK